ncbi:MAG: hypothetical protein ABSH50_24815 [Bryobacteraceae bacterium]
MLRTLPSAFAAAIIACAGSAWGQSVSVEAVPESVVNRSFPALRDARPTDVEWRSLRFRAANQYRSILYELVLLREPAAGQAIWFVWTVQGDFPFYVRLDNPAGFPAANQVVRIDQDIMRAFVYMGELLILESKARTSSMDAAQKLALADFKDSGKAAEMVGNRLWAPNPHWIRLDDLPKGVRWPPPDWRLPPTPLRAEARSGRCWSFELAGATESARLLVDDNYDLATAEECAKPAGRSIHVSVVRSEPPVAAPALRNNKPTTIEFHSLLTEVIYPDRRTGQVHVLMLYDPSSKLFWWWYWPNYPNPRPARVENENEILLRSESIFVTDDRLVVFSNRTAIDSTERYPDFRKGQEHVLSALDTVRGDIQYGGGRPPQRILHYTGIPDRFFSPDCPNAMGAVIQLKQVARVDGFWKLTLTGTYASNGNSAVLSLQDNYETAGVELLPKEHPGPVVRNGMKLGMGCGN